VLGDAGKDTGMTVHKKVRRGKPRWVIDIPYRHRKSGKRVRFRKDADVQTSAAAHAEERRLIAEYERKVSSARLLTTMVQKLAGHRHMQVTARYAHADEATRAVIEAIDRRHGS
jgi:mevalonate kinase